MPSPMLVLVAALLVQALVAPPATADAGVPDPSRLKAHMAFLADDLLEGRETGTRGYDIAARYVAAQFTQMGLKPAGDPGSYLQTVPLRGGTVEPNAAVFEIRRPGGTQALVSLREFLMGPRLYADQVDVTAPLVFVGHGATAPRFQHDDYAGIDVRGKIVVYLSGRPRHFPSEEGAHYASRLTKSRLAARHGALAVIELQTPEDEQRSPFARGALFNGVQSIDWVTADGRGSREVPGMRGAAFVSATVASQLFTEVDVNAAAFLDGLGVQPSFIGDTVLNGAMDNASGVATLLEMARLIAAMPAKPRRSMLFIAVTGEEKGLTGSAYFATLPTVPAAAMVANVNLDMPNLLIDFNEVVAFGAERSGLKGAALRAAAATHVTLVPDPSPELAIFIRSDHYSFVQQGVPSVYMSTGTGSFDPTEDGRKSRESFRREHYHRPSDDMKLPFNWGAAVRFTRLNYLLGLDVANNPQRPRWNDGDFFGELFGKKPSDN